MISVRSLTDPQGHRGATYHTGSPKDSHKRGERNRRDRKISNSHKGTYKTINHQRRLLKRKKNSSLMNFKMICY